MTPLALLRHLRHDGASDVVLVQTGPSSAVPALVDRMRAMFPGAIVHLVTRDESLAEPGALPGVHVESAREGGGWDLLRRLRRKRFDVVAVHLAGEPSDDLGRLAILLRARAMLAFNRNLDHFPINVHRAPTIAEHLGVGHDAASLAAWAARHAAARLVVAPAAAAWLAAKVGWRRLRGPVPRARLLAGRRDG